MTVYATIADLELRFPSELITIAANEQTGERDDVRIGLALTDASIEIRAILAARYSSAEMASFDADALEVLRVYATDIAFFRVALSFSRQSDSIKDRYDMALKRLEAIACGKGALGTTIVAGGTGGNSGGADTGAIGQNEVSIDVPERVFTRKRLGSI